jgi:hypothetical protein
MYFHLENRLLTPRSTFLMLPLYQPIVCTIYHYHPTCRILRKSPLQPNCQLIVTKRFGTGTLLAANMRAKAKATWMETAHNSMLQSNQEAGKIFFAFHANACTDITGFGLLGHLLEMMKYQQHGVQLQQKDDINKDKEPIHEELPVGGKKIDQVLNVRLFLTSIAPLPGALECIENGIFSTLHPQVETVFTNLGIVIFSFILLPLEYSKRSGGCQFGSVQSISTFSFAHRPTSKPFDSFNS